MKCVKNVITIALLASLAACGGGGGSPGGEAPGNPPGGQTPGGDSSINVVSFDHQIDKFVLLNSGLDQAKLTVTALDQNNNPVSGAAVKVVVDSGIYTPDSSSTDTKGQVSGAVSIGGNKSNRNIGVTITVNGKVKTETISVTGSQITFNTLPAAPKQGDPVVINVDVTDANNTGIPNAAVDIAGTLGFSTSVKTGPNGKATANISAAPAPGKYTVAITASGVEQKRDLQVVDTSGSGGVPDAVGVISAAALAIAPNTVRPNTAGSSANQATLRATFRDAQNRAIENVRVRFEIMSSDSPGNSISTGGQTVYADVNGVANAAYIAGTSDSSANGIVIRMCYGMTDAAIAGGLCPNSDVKTMTVAAAPVSISMGHHNKLETGNGGLTYIKRFDVSVVDAAGNAVPNAEISASVDLRRYVKAPGIPVKAPGVSPGPRYVCWNEDINRNGMIDPGDDLDGDGVLTPRQATVAISFPSSNKTGANGRTTIQVEYAQNFATWLEYVIKATTKVSGSEGTVEGAYVTEYLEADEANGSFHTPPYGMNDCSTSG